MGGVLIKYIVSTNQSTVWVNGENSCVARFCKLSQEFFYENKNNKIILHKKPHPIKYYWKIFKLNIFNTLKIDIKDYAPTDILNCDSVIKQDNTPT